MKYIVQCREFFMVNTDPQRRCYNGCNFSEEKQWTDWHDLSTTDTEEEAIDSVKGWERIGRKTCEFRYKVKEAS